jgi:formate-dependent nitrite reductase membrane component NrfD
MLKRLFDLRMIIGVLLTVYGVILTITGALDGSSEIAKGVGVRINLWTGLALLVIGMIFIVWDVTRPEKVEEAMPDPARTGQE